MITVFYTRAEEARTGPPLGSGNRTIQNRMQKRGNPPGSVVKMTARARAPLLASTVLPAYLPWVGLGTGRNLHLPLRGVLTDARRLIFHPDAPTWFDWPKQQKLHRKKEKKENTKQKPTAAQIRAD